jgi:hypothetical protein
MSAVAQTSILAPAALGTARNGHMYAPIAWRETLRKRNQFERITLHIHQPQLILARSVF